MTEPKRLKIVTKLATGIVQSPDFALNKERDYRHVLYLRIVYYPRQTGACGKVSVLCACKWLSLSEQCFLYAACVFH